MILLRQLPSGRNKVLNKQSILHFSIAIMFSNHYIISSYFIMNTLTRINIKNERPIIKKNSISSRYFSCFMIKSLLVNASKYKTIDEYAQT
jgi:hypothetical protein